MNIKIINQYTYTIRGVWSEMFDSIVYLKIHLNTISIKLRRFTHNSRSTDFCFKSMFSYIMTKCSFRVSIICPKSKYSCPTLANTTWANFSKYDPIYTICVSQNATTQHSNTLDNAHMIRVYSAFFKRHHLPLFTHR